MAFIDWDESLSLGLATFDTQHMKMVEMINELHEAMKEGRGREHLDAILSGLKSYTINHFSAEEEAMRRYGFPGLDRHASAHEDLVRQVKSMDLGRDEVTTVDLIEFMKRWLTAHIKGVDREYAPFLRSQGMR